MIDGMAPAPGGRLAPGGATAAVFSANATAIDVSLFAPDGTETARHRLTQRTGFVWHDTLPGVLAGQHYGLRAHGPWDPAAGHRFDPAKMLLDPFATELTGPVLPETVLAAIPYGAETAHHMPKCVAREGLSPIDPGERPHTAWRDTVIYEAHVRGLTRLWPGMPPEIAGTVEALQHPEIIAHLQALGITTLELMPLHAAADEPHLVKKGLRNYWGYNSLGVIAPEPRLLGPGGIAGLRATVAALHAAGIEVILDVVYNHTAEGDGDGPTYAFRGLDNLSYYARDTSRPDGYANETGCGNRVDLSNPFVLRHTMDSLRWWATRIGVDGFRFDLAPALLRGPETFEPGSAFLTAVAQDPVLRSLKLIAEPWDIGAGGHRTGGFPAPWAEWNDGYRDAIRGFWRGDAMPGELADGLLGSARVFDHAGRAPWASVNFVACHDGFTLADLTRFEERHNHANGEDNRDGHGHNISQNFGVEGPSDDDAINAARSRRQRVLIATALLSLGTPMLRAGDEVAQSQNGNNNAYCQDNTTTWVDWTVGDDALCSFIGHVLAVRRAHPALRAAQFLHGERRVDGASDVTWLSRTGEAVDWGDPSGLALLIRGPDTEISDPVLVVLNRGGACTLTLPEPDGRVWHRLIDTEHPGIKPQPEATQKTPIPGPALVLFAARLRPDEPAEHPALTRLARAAGVAAGYHRIDGGHVPTSPSTDRAMIAALRLPEDPERAATYLASETTRKAARPLPSEIVVEADQPAKIPGLPWQLVTECGRRIDHDPDRPGYLPPLPMGIHTLTLGGHAVLILAAPRRAPQTCGPTWGVTTALYGLRSARNHGIGDFEDLARTAEALAGTGAAFVGINPVHQHGVAELGISPYAPSSRTGLEPAHIALDRFATGTAREGGTLVDYAAARAVANSALRAAWADGRPTAEFETFWNDAGPETRHGWLYEALSQQHGPDWRTWPETLTDPDSPETRRAASDHADETRHHAWRQWLARRQLSETHERARAAGMRYGLYLDIAVGVRPGGAETWATRTAFARGVSLGAPPDMLSADGQRWNLSPFSPDGLRVLGFAPFRAMLRATMAHAGIVRIDHVIGLMQSFWMPDDGVPGTYVAFPLETLLAIVRIEAARTGCIVVGEDLGTVPNGLRDALSDSGLFGYTLMIFERDGEVFRPPSAYRRETLAAFGSHDVPALAGWWTAHDITQRGALGQISTSDAAGQMTARHREKQALASMLGVQIPDGTPGQVLADAVHRALGDSGGDLVALSLDDIHGVIEPQNVPGTVDEVPNWRRRAPVRVEDLPGDTALRRAADAVGRAQ